uniref:Homeobox domain-containing protein n=1 Tax=Myripristis murdjan TaxID=586833 RepID=A0A667ZFZ3_9TELE
MVPLSLPQLPIPPLSLPKLPLPPIPFPMELPLLPPVVMQSVALQSQPWLDSGVTPDLAKLYQSQLSPALLGQQPQLSPALLAQQPQLSPALIDPPPSLSPGPSTSHSPQLHRGELHRGRRSSRTRFTEQQLETLQGVFEATPYPREEEYDRLSALLSLPNRVIVVWFQNARQRARKNQDRGPSMPSNPIPNHGLVISSKELPMKPSLTTDLATDLNNPEDEDDYEEEEEEYPGEEGSSMADQGSLSPESSGGPSSEWGETQTERQHHQYPHQQQQRQRTQMSHFQVLQLRDFYRNHRTPNRRECEALGQELGLPHRVVQVEFH